MAYFAQEHASCVAPSTLAEQSDGVSYCLEQRNAFKVLLVPSGMLPVDGGEDLLAPELVPAERGECHLCVASVSPVVVIG
ncbi:hypothetical protein COU79_01390 [Candidatus Peregrinibacteria bacterium CG10_big_fil_rev_8_21_14_0_10_54_7]|nr:MAG: hypothetical protein COU79_01390 [Candidatus Peregrinibacteria bacterium CG10_big_fil_rev_8_21_14_0_10_54_7]